MENYDVVVVGSGTAGQTVAYDLNEQGLTVAVVERSHNPGGTCALRGCQPKKYFYEITETIARCRHLTGMGIVSAPETSWGQVMTQKNRFVSPIPEGTVKGFEEAGIAYLEGVARCVDTETISVDNRPISCGHLVLATGARPMPLPFEGSEYVITSDEFLYLPNLPNRIVFVGGGFISFEFAHFAARLGPQPMQIQILETNDRPLGQFDADMVNLLLEASREDNIQVMTRTMIVAVEKHETGFIVKTKSGDRLEADLVVHGAGRVPDIDDLNLEAVGIHHTQKGIMVNERMQTANPRVFAVGDCAATIQLARVADHEAHVAAENILADLHRGQPAVMDYRTAPFALFSYPQYGMIGKTEDAIRQDGIEYQKSTGHHLTWPTYKRVGLKHAAYKIMTGPDHRIIGAHILSDNATGILNTLKLAMHTGLTVQELYRQSIMSPYPSRESDLIYMLKPLL